MGHLVAEACGADSDEPSSWPRSPIDGALTGLGSASNSELQPNKPEITERGLVAALVSAMIGPAQPERTIAKSRTDEGIDGITPASW